MSPPTAGAHRRRGEARASTAGRGRRGVASRRGAPRAPEAAGSRERGREQSPRGEPPRVMSRADRGARGSGRRRDHSCKPSLDPAAASRVLLGLSGVGLVAARWAVRPERSSADSALLPSGSLRGSPRGPESSHMDTPNCKGGLAILFYI